MFFFRETAVEYINCGKNVYSRVARACKEDTGGKNILTQNWATYLKARLNCSIPGEFPFYFNEIRECLDCLSQKTVCRPYECLKRDCPPKFAIFLLLYICHILIVNHTISHQLLKFRLLTFYFSQQSRCTRYLVMTRASTPSSPPV